MRKRDRAEVSGLHRTRAWGVVAHHVVTISNGLSIGVKDEKDPPLFVYLQ